MLFRELNLSWSCARQRDLTSVPTIWPTQSLLFLFLGHNQQCLDLLLTLFRAHLWNCSGTFCGVRDCALDSHVQVHTISLASFCYFLSCLLKRESSKATWGGMEHIEFGELELKQPVVWFSFPSLVISSWWCQLLWGRENFPSSQRGF